MSGDGRPLSVRLHEKAKHLEASMPATAQDFHDLADEVADLEAPCACGRIDDVVKVLEEAGWYVAIVGGETSWVDTKPPVPTHYLAISRAVLPAEEVT